MPLYDATVSLREGMLLFPGDPLFKMERLVRIDRGDPFNLSLLSTGTHCGTHVDPPLHYLDGGGGIDSLPLDALIGPGEIVDLRGWRVIDRSALASADLTGVERVLFKTDSGSALHDRVFTKDYVHLTADAATYLVHRGICLVGMDYLSVDAYDAPDGPVHRTLLGAGVVIVECVDLLDIPPGPCEIFCLPLKIEGGDGAPARVIVRREQATKRTPKAPCF